MANTISSPNTVQTSESHQSQWLLWSGALILLGVGGVVTAIGLMSPDNDGFARIGGAVLGALLIAMAGIAASYIMTRNAAIEETRRLYHEYLLGIGRSNARTWAALHRATTRRREGSYASEETYQEVVLSATESILEQYETIVRLCGQSGDAFSSTIEDFAQINSTLYSEKQDVAEANQALDALQSGRSRPEPVTVRCPYCGSRVNGKIPLLVGWTSTADCQHCNERFNIHRRSDMSVFANSNPSLLKTASDRGILRRPMTQVVNGRMEELEGMVAKQDPAVTVRCPECGREISIRGHDDDEKPVFRFCLGCFTAVLVDLRDATVVKDEACSRQEAKIVGHHGAYAIVECPSDATELKASFKGPNQTWLALCAHHHQVLSVTRAVLREWLRSNDPEYLGARLALEANGGAKILSDPE